jgi:hypothetical protein
VAKQFGRATARAARASGHQWPGRSGVRAAGIAVHPTAVVAMAICLILMIVALLGGVGADSRWLAALGHVILARHAIPAGVPFATAPTSHWHNVPVLAELVFNGLERGLGDRGLVIAQLLAVALAFGVLARDAVRAGATGDGVAAAFGLCAVGSLSSLVIARSQLFSLALFPVLVALLRSEYRRPSRRIWLAVPLLGLWSNLHGVVLVGLAVLLAYLLSARARQAPWTAMSLAIASSLALGLTPALLDTASYYRGVLENVAAQRHVALWAVPSLSSPLDDIALAMIAVLGWRAWRSGWPLWEKVAAIGLAAMSVNTARSSVWLLFFLVGPAACTVRRRRDWGWLAPATAVAALAVVGVALARGPRLAGASQELVRRAMALAGETPILAPDTLAERVALAGGRISVGDPLDAFSTRDQGVYLDWIAGAPHGVAALSSSVRIVLVERGSAAARLMNRAVAYRRIAGDRSTVVYRRGG